MSTATAPDTHRTTTEPVDSPEVVREKAGVDRVVRLQEEYRKKLRWLLKRYAEQKSNQGESTSTFFTSKTAVLKAKANRSWLNERARPLVSAAENLARYASGLIENARLPQIDKIELQLRNAELEAELIEARHLIG